MKRLCVTVLLLLWGLQALADGEKSRTIVYIDGAKYYIHTVQAGETLYGLSKIYGVDEKVLLQSNPQLAAGLKKDQNIKIPYVAEATEIKPEREKRLRKTYDFHYVSKGETLYAISRQYEIPVNTLMEDNPDLDPLHMRLGQRILIRRQQIGSEDEKGSNEQWEQYRQSLNSVADKGTAYHIVHAGETFYSLSRRFGVSEEELSAMNNGLRAADLKAGAMIKVPREGDDSPVMAQSDSLQRPQVGPQPAQIHPLAFKALRSSETLRVALLLPLSVDNEPGSNFVEFYQGFLMGLDSVKTRLGYSVQVDLFNTARDTSRIHEIIRDEAFRNADLIVGPVYEEGLYPVLVFAEQKEIPVVSPLANIERMNSDALFQLAPDPSCKYDKVKELIAGNKRITLIYTASTDKEFEQEILALLGDTPYRKFNYKYVHPSSSSQNSSSDLTPLLENEDDNLFIVLSDDEVELDRVLAALASADNGITSRGRTAPRFRVLGNARWNRYNLDRELFFKDRVTFISTYHAKRDAEIIKTFDSAYIRAFGTLPTLYSYRGYDTAMIFAPAMFGDIEYDLEQKLYTPLQTTYRFERNALGNHVNRNWMRVNYQNDFTITIE